MVNETILPGVAEEAIKSLTNTIAALGGIILLYLIYQTISIFIMRRKNKEIEKINENLEDIKKLLGGKKRK